ncbi:MAG TPA: hypothetical protein VLM83_12360 [Anaerolineales bacterium]|nr:hypothetical protein [Anaerolineales bacterium]
MSDISSPYAKLGYLLLGACLLLGVYITLRIWPGEPGKRRASILRMSLNLFLTILAFMLVPVLTLLCSIAGMLLPSDSGPNGAAIGGGFVGVILGLILAIILTILIWSRKQKKEKPVAAGEAATTGNDEEVGTG